jgi:hypothetical protein
MLSRRLPDWAVMASSVSGEPVQVEIVVLRVVVCAEMEVIASRMGFAGVWALVRRRVGRRVRRVRWRCILMMLKELQLD